MFGNMLYDAVKGLSGTIGVVQDSILAGDIGIAQIAGLSKIKMDDSYNYTDVGSPLFYGWNIDDTFGQYYPEDIKKYFRSIEENEYNWILLGRVQGNAFSNSYSVVVERTSNPYFQWIKKYPDWLRRVSFLVLLSRRGMLISEAIVYCVFSCTPSGVTSKSSKSSASYNIFSIILSGQHCIMNSKINHSSLECIH